MPITIALPKGRLGEDAEKLMLEHGIMSTPIPRDSRKLIFECGPDVQAILVRAWDVPSYVEMGTADIGVCGKDDLIEHDADVFEPFDLGFGLCHMSLATRKGVSREDLLSRSMVRVATKYPNIARRYFASLSVQAEIIKLYGSVELAAVTGLADCIVDLVSTGGTLRENGLCEVETLFESTARLIVNHSSYYLQHEKVQGILSLLTGEAHA